MALLAIEFLLLFFIGLAIFATRRRIPAISALRVVTAYCLFLLLRDPQFDPVSCGAPRSQPLSANPLRRSLCPFGKAA